MYKRQPYYHITIVPYYHINPKLGVAQNCTNIAVIATAPQVTLRNVFRDTSTSMSNIWYVSFLIVKGKVQNKVQVQNKVHVYTEQGNLQKKIQV